MLRKRLNGVWLSIWIGLLMMPAMAMAAGGGKVEQMVIVADTRGLPPWEAWWANLYNESHVYFTIVTIIIIPVVGVIFGTIADLFMGMIGIDLKSRDLAEH
uniref:ABC transporter permease n=1 Tax=Desulfatirhabdium butyrativorans TaxID=340467 RepID=A0A7C4RNB5_9BACT